MNTRTVTLTLLAACVFAAAAPAGAQTVVARVKVHNAADAEMKDVVVRGALPLPAGYDKPVAGLALRDGGKVLTTQVSVFSTYPGSDLSHLVGRPEVVQLAARATLPAGTVKQFDVVQLPAAPKVAQAAAPGKALADWLAGKAPVVVEATDCFGNRYRARPLRRKHLIKTRQGGRVMMEKVYQSILTPVAAAGGEKPALKRFLRVRAYVTTYADEEFATLALMIHNGSIDRPNGPVYYRRIRVGVAEPMALAVRQKRFSPAADAGQSVADGYTWQPCPAGRADGKVFVMPHGSAAVLRMTVYAPAVKERALQFAEHAPLFVPAPGGKLFSWSNPATARYGSPKYPMPLRLGDDAFRRAEKAVASRLKSPTLGWDLVYLRQKPKPAGRTLGHAMPAGVAYGGMTGGHGIHYVFGARAALTGHNGLIRLHVLLADRNFDRQRAHLFYDDGRPYIYRRHVAELAGRKVLDWPYNHRGFPEWPVADPACRAHAEHVKENDLLAPEARTFMRYMNHDDQHLSRVFDAVPAAYLACDPLNRDRLVTLGAQACWKRNIYPIKGRRTFGGWGGLFGARKHVDARPQAGISMDRAHGWVMHSLGWAHCLSQDRQIRADCVDIARTDVYVRAKAQMAAGNVSIRRASAKALGGRYDFTTAWEEGAILADGARCAVNILSSPENQAHADRMKAIYVRVGRWTATAAWNDQAKSPGFHVGLRKKGSKELLDKPIPKGGAAFYMGTPFAWYYELTGEKLFLDRLEEMAGKTTLARRAQRDLGNWSYALYLAQGGEIPGRGKARPGETQ